MNGQGDNITQSEVGRSDTGGDRDAEEQGALLHDRPNAPSGQRVIRYFSMFSGVGGFELGLEQSLDRRFECMGFSEIDKYSIQTYLKHFPSHKNYGDATKIDSRELPDFDMLCGGFPCQSFSIAGKRRGFEDTRGTMFFEIARILEVKRPELVFLENVKGLLNHNKGQTFSTIIQALEELGYDVQWMVFNSKFFGVPQNRERVFIIGSLRGAGKPEILPFGSLSEEIIELQRQQIHPTITEAIGRAGSSSEYKSAIANTVRARHLADANGSYIAEREQFSQKGEPMIRRLTPTEMKVGRGMNMIADYRYDEGLRIREDGNSPALRQELNILLVRQDKAQHGRVYSEEGISPTLAGASKLSGDCTPKIAIPVLTPNREDKRQNGRRFKENGEEAFTLTKTDIHGVSDGVKIRRLTPTECERLQGFPDGWTEGVSDTQRYKQMGNAVTVNVIRAIGDRLR